MLLNKGETSVWIIRASVVIATRVKLPSAQALGLGVALHSFPDGGQGQPFSTFQREVISMKRKGYENKKALGSKWPECGPDIRVQEELTLKGQEDMQLCISNFQLRSPESGQPSFKVLGKWHLEWGSFEDGWTEVTLEIITAPEHVRTGLQSWQRAGSAANAFTTFAQLSLWSWAWQIDPCERLSNPALHRVVQWLVIQCEDKQETPVPLNDSDWNW